MKTSVGEVVRLEEGLTEALKQFRTGVEVDLTSPKSSMIDSKMKAVQRFLRDILNETQLKITT